LTPADIVCRAKAIGGDLMKGVLTTAAITVAIALLPAQTALTGKWQGKTPNGADLMLDLTATDTTVTGTLSRNSETVRITDGNVSKTAFTFKATFGEQAETLTGEVAGDQITIWLERQGPSNAVILKRVKN
jgi:hypothetical protein